jgi:PAS domain S-box-containing protein
VNEAVCLFSGYSENELLTLSMMDLTHQESIDKLEVCFGRLKILGESKGEFKIVHKTGEVRWSRVDSVKLSETRFMGFVKDITEIKRANDLLINTFDRITDAFVALDMDWCYTYMNKKAGEILNCDPVEMIGKNIWAEFPESINGSYYNTCFKSIETQKHNHFENFHEFSERWFENHIYPSNDGLSIFFRDITEEKIVNDKIEENEKRFRSLVENSDGIITVVDENLNVLFRSPSSKNITGYTDKEFDEIPDNEYFHPDYLEYIYEIIKKAVNNPGKLFPALFRVKHKKGHYIWLEGVINNRFHDSSVNGIVSNFRDVTDKMEANATLKKERDVFAKIAATSPGLIYSMRQNFDGSLCYPYASDAIKEIYGHSFEEVSNNANVIFDLIHPDDKERIIAKIINTKTNLVPLKGEYRYQHPTKGTVWHEVNSLPVVEPEGTVICHGIITDITERKKAEEALKKMHKKLESIFDAIPDLLFEVGIDGNIYNFHSRNTDLPQIYSNDIIGKTFFDILPLDAANLVLSAINESIVNGFSNGRQYSLSFPTGIRWFELSIAPMEENEHHDTHFICLSREITDAKKGDEALLKSEERYRGLLNNLDAGVVVHALDTSIIMNNQKASDLLGLKEGQMFGKLNTDRGLRFLNEDGSKMLFENIPVNQIISTKKSIKNFTTGIKRLLSNDIVWILVNGYPLFDSKSDLIEIVISFIDITKRKRMEIEIVEGRKLAESANKAKTDFLANMSHEIRTPLNGIIGFTNLLMKSNLGNNQSEYMSTINESAQSLMQIVNDVLDFSKIESGKLELEKEGIDLFKLIHQVIDLFKHQAQEKDIDLLLFIDKAVPQFVLADSVRLKQILVNLLSNALKFTIVGEVSLYINALPDVNENYSTVQFAVKDTGIGIKEINNAKIFQSFVQEDSSTTRKFGGTGLGLAISNQLLELMNSKLNLISNYGVGSDFFFEIKFEKLTHIKKLHSKENTSLDDEVIIVSNVLRDKKVLIVEDNRINMLLAKTLVKRLISNCTIYEARDGNEAIEQYKNEKLDIILMDIQMPNKNGYEATLQIRELEDSEEIPIIAVTAGIMIGDKEKCFEAGLNDYLSKPIIEDDLKKILIKWFNK